MISHSSVERVLELHATKGSVEPAPHGGGARKRLSDDDRAVLSELVKARPDATQDELAGALDAQAGVRVSRSTISRELHGLGLTLKKKSGIARERCTPEVELRARPTSRGCRRSSRSGWCSWTRPAPIST